MSLLDRKFLAVATRGLPVWQPHMPGESTLEPGYLYRVEGADQSAIFGIAAHRVRDVVGQRIALKIVTAAETPPGGTLSLLAPDGQQVEGDDGLLVHNASLGTQALGSYHEWICDPDGNWILISRVGAAGEVGLPLGQIVIQGVPVVIEGTPLVITPPAPPPAPLVTVPPAIVVGTIVPRPAPIVPRAVTPTIELVDAFADGSLEMTAAGDLFRVASVRYPATLRATSLDSTSFVEIGVLRLDATPFGAEWTLTVELDVSNAGQAVELQLYNLTAAAPVVLLTGGSLVTTKQTAAVTLPLTEQLYSVRMRRVGGSPGQMVSCRSVVLER